MMKLDEAKDTIAYFMRRLYTQGLTTTSGGNISMRWKDGTVLITPSASDKGQMKGCEIGQLDMDGNITGLPFRPTIESRMHLGIYKSRPDVEAIVHAHPVNVSAFAASKARISNKFLAESYAILGEIAYAEYYCMGSEELAKAVSAASASSNCIVMRNHGALAVGKSLLEAFDRLEVLEAAAKITIINRGVLRDDAVELGARDMAELDRFMKRQ
ncbi:MAG: hypothetical protein A2017_14125 [Lentisphaerae bacterium GWF2_44_16]|nr:MAG: hypothetical protein A2017_14125 [Lentisphaerae bacterium GWF2_44_16]